jgi:hypothetical protein
MVTKIIFIALDKARKPYYVESKNPHVGALFTTALLGLAPVASLVQLPPKLRKSMSACRSDESMIANSDGSRPGGGSSLSVAFLRPARASAGEQGALSARS